MENEIGKSEYATSGHVGERAHAKAHIKVAHIATTQLIQDEAKVIRNRKDKGKVKTKVGVEKMEAPEKEKATVHSHPQETTNATTAAATILRELARNQKEKATAIVKAVANLLAGSKKIIQKGKGKGQHPRLGAKNANIGMQTNSQTETNASLIARLQTAAIG